MKRTINFIIKNKILVIIIFTAACLISIFSQSLVKINYDLSTYLPKSSPSTHGIEVMASQFKEEIFNINIMIPNASINKALDLKSKLKELPEVQGVIWLDDYIDVQVPMTMADQGLIDTYYKNQNAYFMVTVKTSNYPPVLSKLQTLVGKDAHIVGRMVQLAMAQNSTQSEIAQIMIFIIPLVSVILVLATHSWLEPVLMLLAIGVGILLNMGTNIIFRQISFLTQAVSAILQLAVSMDYAIFLLHKFAELRLQTEDTQEAMRLATIKSLPTLMASSITTFIGFLALVLMRFQIGPDIGIVLAKGVFFSLVSVLFFLPCLTILSVKWIDKTTHRSYLPKFDFLSKTVHRISPLIIITILVVMIPSFLAQRKNTFMYGMGEYQQGSREQIDVQAVSKVYGNETQMVILVPKGQLAREVKMVEKLQTLPEVKSILSYVTMVGVNIPSQVLPENQISSLLSKDFSRLILQVKSKDEGEKAFKLVEQVRLIIDEFYPNQQTHLIGSSVITYDMAKTIQQDDIVVNGLAILAIFLTILFSFKSISVPIILVLAIEISIWINLSFPYFLQTPLNYIGYLIISTVQLGATVDYGVLFTQNYLENREKDFKKPALLKTIRQTAGSVLPPAIILVVTGFILGIISSIHMVSELGWTLGRGALTSLLMVIFFVPGVYYLLDSLVEKTTLKTNFKKEVKNHEEKII